MWCRVTPVFLCRRQLYVYRRSFPDAVHFLWHTVFVSAMLLDTPYDYYCACTRCKIIQSHQLEQIHVAMLAILYRRLSITTLHASQFFLRIDSSCCLSCAFCLFWKASSSACFFSKCARVSLCRVSMYSHFDFNSCTCRSNSAFSFSNVSICFSISAFPCSESNAFRIPHAIADSYRVW